MGRLVTAPTHALLRTNYDAMTWRGAWAALRGES